GRLISFTSPMRRWVFLLLTAMAASASACELLVSTSGFDEPPDPTDAAPDAVTSDAPRDVVVLPDVHDAGLDSEPKACACYREAGAAYGASVARAHATREGCLLDAGGGTGDLLHCADGVWTLALACSSGCATNGAEIDQCLCPCTSGPGDYCGFTVQDAGAK